MRTASALAVFGRFGTHYGRFRIFPYLCTETRPNGRISTIVQPRTVVKRRGVFPYRLNSSGDAHPGTEAPGPNVVCKLDELRKDYKRFTNGRHPRNDRTGTRQPAPFY